MNKKKVLVLGSTGLVGHLVISYLNQDINIHEVVCLVRRPVNFQSQKIKYYTVNFKNLDNYLHLFEGITDVICCIGTTIKKAKSKEKFTFVDYEIPLKVAKIIKKENIHSFNLVSSMGASSKSRFFYLKVKGNIEDDLKKVNFHSLNIYRPSLLVGNRSEIRVGEKITEAFFKFFSLIIPKKYLPTDSNKLAKLIVENLQQDNSGNQVFESFMI
tara:strand:- start:5808 stop:6449 length:642 start_codon:yes stop_codon:yes gene_type:complete